MKTLYLHIGTPKTGTSAIQNFCVKNRDTLEKQGLYYPDFGFRFTSSHANRNGAFYINNIFDDQKNRMYEEENKVRREGMEKLQKAFEDHDTILLSDEGFWNHEKMDADGWKELLEQCNEMGVQLKPIVYLRRQDEVIQSYWSQKVKEINLKSSLSNYIDSGKYTKFNLDYYSKLQEITSVIGKENIIVKVYEKGQYQGKNGTLISDFFSIFDLDISKGYVEEGAQKNRSLYGTYLEAKRLLNASQEFGKREFSLVNRLRNLQELDEDSARLSKIKQFSYEEALDFLKKYEEGNQNIAKEYLGREDGTLFYDKLNPSEYSKFEASPEDIQKVINICAKIIVIQEQELKEAKAKLKDQKQVIKQLKSPEGWKKYLRKLRMKK